LKMAAFGIEITDKKVIPKILEVRTNLFIEDLVKNPFQGKITAHGERFFTVIMNPVYPRVYLFSFFPLAVSLLFGSGFWRTALLIVGLIMLGTSVFWSNRFYYLLFRYKTGGGIKYVPPSEALERVV